MPLFPVLTLPPAVAAELQRQNPWWRGASQRVLPAFRRWPFATIMTRLGAPLAPILVIRGPRQIGKTTLQEQVIESLLGEGVAASRILRVQFDALPSLRELPQREDPILRLAGFFERKVLGRSFNDAARAGEPAFLFFDEVQNVRDWDVQLKALVDHSTVAVVVTGSSALRIERGRDSLAGRIQTIEVGPLRLWEVGVLGAGVDLQPFQRDNGLQDWLAPEFWRALERHASGNRELRDRAFAAFSERGAYPFAHRAGHVPWPEIADHLVETVVRRVIQHDLRIGERGRKRDQQLLEEVFRLGCRWAGQAPGLGMLADEIRQALASNVGPQRVRHYLGFLDSSLLLRTIRPLEVRLKKRRGPEKIVLSDPSLRAAWLQEKVPLAPEDLAQAPELSTLAGHLAESTVGYLFASLPGLDTSHQPERPGAPEVDFVLSIGDRRIPVEVKYQARIDPVRDTYGIRSFLEKSANRASFGLLVVQQDSAAVLDPRIVCLPLRSLLLVR